MPGRNPAVFAGLPERRSARAGQARRGGEDLGAGRHAAHLPRGPGREEPPLLLRPGLPGGAGTRLSLPDAGAPDGEAGRQDLPRRLPRERVRPDQHPARDRGQDLHRPRQDRRLRLHLPPDRRQARPHRHARRVDLGRHRVERVPPPPRLLLLAGGLRPPGEPRRQRHGLDRGDRDPAPDEVAPRHHPLPGQVVHRGEARSLQPVALPSLDAVLRERRCPRQRRLPGGVPAEHRVGHAAREGGVRRLADRARELQPRRLHGAGPRVRDRRRRHQPVEEQHPVDLVLRLQLRGRLGGGIRPREEGRHPRPRESPRRPGEEVLDLGERRPRAGLGQAPHRQRRPRAGADGRRVLRQRAGLQLAAAAPQQGGQPLLLSAARDRVAEERQPRSRRRPRGDRRQPRPDRVQRHLAAGRCAGRPEGGGEGRPRGADRHQPLEAVLT